MIRIVDDFTIDLMSQKRNIQKSQIAQCYNTNDSKAYNNAYMLAVQIKGESIKYAYFEDIEDLYFVYDLIK